jgi:hypothetical protein
VSRPTEAMRETDISFALCGVEALERQNDALLRLQPLANCASQEFAGPFLDLALRDPTREQCSHASRGEHRPALLDYSLGELCGLRRLGADDDEETSGRIAQPMRGSENAAAN